MVLEMTNGLNFPSELYFNKKKNCQKKSKKFFQKKFPLTTLDFRIAALADIHRENTLFLDKNLLIIFNIIQMRVIKTLKCLTSIGLKEG